MKKWLQGFAIGVLALALAACGDAANEKAEPKPGTAEEKKSELTLEEVFNKAQEASEDVKNMHADMDIAQHIIAGEENMESTIKMKMDAVIDPFAMYQVMEMEIAGEGSMKTEMYLTDSGFFMKDPESGTWLKLPEDMYDEIATTTDATEGATVDFASLKEYLDDFTFEQNDDEYILKLKASGEKFNKLIQDELESAGLLEQMGDEAALEEMKINEVEYEIFIDKETFDTTAFNLVMDMEMSAEGETVQIKQDVKSKISKINEIDEITVPAEVLDEAVEY